MIIEELIADSAISAFVSFPCMHACISLPSQLPKTPGRNELRSTPLHFHSARTHATDTALVLSLATR